MADRIRGFGGGVAAGYAAAAELEAWTLEAIGPSLYRLRAGVARHVPPLLAFAPLRVWIRRSEALRWEWMVSDGSVAVADGVLEAVVGQPRIGPAP